MLIDNQEKYQTILLTFLESSDSPVAIDTETNITDRYQERFLMGISLCKDDQSYYIPVAHSSWMDPDGQNLEVPTDLLTHIRGPIVMHNAKFDLHVLRKAGVVVPEIILYDTMLMAHLINENHFNYSLDALASQFLGVHKEKDLAKVMKSEWDNMPAPVMAKYAEQDARITLQLYEYLKPQFEPYEEYWRTEEKFLLLLQQMEQKGILVDTDRARELQLLCHTRIGEIQEELGFDPSKPSQLHAKLFGIPPIGLGLRITHTTPKGKPQVNTAFLESCNHPIAGLLLEWRKLQKELTSYYNPYVARTEGYGRLHADFQQHGTVTGRLSCKDPNMQQIPRDSPVKKLFLAEPGKQLWEIDFKNIEMRLAAVYSKQVGLYDVFQEEGDVHQRTADELGVSRQHAKTINFLIIYGGGPKALATQLRIPEAKAKQIHQSYKKAYSDLFKIMDSAKEAADDRGEVRYWSGRKRHFKWPSEHIKAFNSIVQGGSFDIVKRSMLRLSGAGFDIRSQVHDSVWLMVDGEEDILRAEKIMTEWTTELFGLTFSVESKRLA